MRRLLLAATLLTAMALPGIAGAAESSEPAPAAEAYSADAPPPDFQPYIFWAFGLSCAILLGFSLWSLAESRALHRKIDYLTERFRRAHPEHASGDEPRS